ncbi:MAG: hypothetical protein ACMZI0_10630 [Symbiopectobacterium sp.]|uniref:hypothetical protein n=1 Tax=Symbiopectobacterium sp. TaxID=2952789 RepID=UPI0039E7D4E7
MPIIAIIVVVVVVIVLSKTGISDSLIGLVIATYAPVAYAAGAFYLLRNQHHVISFIFPTDANPGATYHPDGTAPTGKTGTKKYATVQNL